MTRVLRFDPSDPRSISNFSVCWQAMLFGGQAFEQRARQTRSFDQQRREGKVLDALEVVSEPDPDDVNKTGLRRLAVAGEVTLTGEGLALLSDYIENIGWMGKAVRDAIATRDWLATAKTIETPAK